MGLTPPTEEGTQRRRDLPATFPQALTNGAWDMPRNLHTRGCLHSPPSGPASCSGWSNGTKSVFLRGLVPFNQLQQGWQCPVLGGTEEIHLWLKLRARVSLKKMTLTLQYTLMLPGRERGGVLGSQVSKIFLLSTQSFVALRPQPQPLMLLMYTVSKNFEDGIFASSGPVRVRARDLKDSPSAHKGLTV